MSGRSREKKKHSKKGLFYDLSVRIAKAINLIAMTAIFAAAWYLCYADHLFVRFSMRGHWLVIALFCVLYLMIGQIYEAFKMSYHNRGEMIYSQALSCLEVDLIMYLVAILLIRALPNVLPFLLVFVCQMAAATLWTCLASRWYFRMFPASKTVVVWDTRQRVTEFISKYHLERKFEVVETISVADCIRDLSVLDNADTVFLADLHSHDRNIITKYCLLHDIQAYLIPRIGDLILSAARRSYLFHLVALKVERHHPSPERAFLKRLIDIVLSLIAIILASPFMLVIAVCIKKEDHGPVIYRQCRLTKDGRKFNILKFRSMRVDAEQDGIARLSSGEQDDRITRVGQFIRKVRMDELPQLFNILKGDMSIVGPRAERPEIAEQYYQELPEFELRLQMKAGLTGYAQVYGKYNTTPYDKLVMDLMYIANASIFEDIRIMFATVKILFMPESTEGVSEGQTTAIDQDMDKWKTD